MGSEMCIRDSSIWEKSVDPGWSKKIKSSTPLVLESRHLYQEIFDDGLCGHRVARMAVQVILEMW